jgi:hypothetical protein
MKFQPIERRSPQAEATVPRHTVDRRFAAVYAEPVTRQERTRLQGPLVKARTPKRR